MKLLLIVLTVLLASCSSGPTTNPHSQHEAAHFKYSIDGVPVRSGEFRNGSLGRVSVSESGTVIGPNGTNHVTVFLADLPGHSQSTDGVDVIIYENDCSASPIAIFEYGAKEVDRRILPQAFSIGIPSCIEIRFIDARLSGLDWSLQVVDKFVILIEWSVMSEN